MTNNKASIMKSEDWLTKICNILRTTKVTKIQGALAKWDSEGAADSKRHPKIIVFLRTSKIGHCFPGNHDEQRRSCPRHGSCDTNLAREAER